MKTNEKKLITHAVSGQIAHPSIGKSYWIGYDGIPRTLPSVGSITYDIEVGDICMGLVGDHVEPGVSIKNLDSKSNMTLNHLACVGNVAKIISGEAKGETGIVTGKHGGVDHVIIYFKQSLLDKLVIGDYTVTSITAINVPDTLNAEIITKALQVRIRGPKSLINDLRNKHLSVVVDLAEAQTGTANMKAEVVADEADVHPGGVGNISHAGALIPQAGELGDGSAHNARLC